MTFGDVAPPTRPAACVCGHQALRAVGTGRSGRPVRGAMTAHKPPAYRRLACTRCPLREDAISLHGSTLVQIWFGFSDQRNKVPNWRDFSLFERPVAVIDNDGDEVWKPQDAGLSRRIVYTESPIGTQSLDGLSAEAEDYPSPRLF